MKKQTRTAAVASAIILFAWIPAAGAETDFPLVNPMVESKDATPAREKQPKKAETAEKSEKATRRVVKRPYDSIIARHASQHGLPLALAHAVVRIESNYRPNVRGSAGEIGLMQIKPATARMLGYSGGAKGLYDPEMNIRYGMKYLAMAHRLGGGDTCGTILRYNAGHAAKRMNPVSAAYCAKVKRHMRES